MCGTQTHGIMSAVREMARAKGDLLLTIENPARLGGLAALLAGVLLFVSELVRLYIDVFNPGAYQSIFTIDPWLGVLLGVLLQLGLVGLYVPRANVLGVLGAVGFFLAFSGAWLTTGSSFVDAFTKPGRLPSGEPEEFFGPLLLFGLTFVLGWVLVGIAMFRSRAYPRSAVALLVAGALILLLPLPLYGVVFAVALAWIGYILLTESVREAPGLRMGYAPRLGGLAALLAGVLLVISELLNLLPFELPGGALAVYGWLGIGGLLGLLLALLLQLGLVGLYISRANVVGVLGVVGFFIAFIGSRLVVFPSFADPLVEPSTLLWGGGPEEFLGPLLIFGLLAFVLGWVLVGVTMFRARAYPRAAVALLVAGVLILLVPLPLGGVVFAAALAWIGYVLFAGRSGGGASPQATYA
jgi:hypothetical protein